MGRLVKYVAARVFERIAKEARTMVSVLSLRLARVLGMITTCGKSIRQLPLRDTLSERRASK